jgi:hypothetical protein
MSWIANRRRSGLLRAWSLILPLAVLATSWIFQRFEANAAVPGPDAAKTQEAQQLAARVAAVQTRLGEPAEAPPESTLGQWYNWYNWPNQPP